MNLYYSRINIVFLELKFSCIYTGLLLYIIVIIVISSLLMIINYKFFYHNGYRKKKFQEAKHRK